MKLFQIEKIAIIIILKMKNSYRNRTIHKNSEFREFPLINIFNVFNPRHKEAKIQLFVGNCQEITNPEYTPKLSIMPTHARVLALVKFTKCGGTVGMYILISNSDGLR